MQKRYFLFMVLVVFCLVSISNIYAIKPGDCKYVKDDKIKVDKNGYIMSWLILDPYIKDNVGATVSTGKDYFEDQKGEANLKPKEGDKVKIALTKSEHVWTRLNFSDLKDMGQITATVGGNEFDIACWGGVDNAQEYMVTYLKWNSDTSIILTLSSDDGSASFLNGKQITSKAADQDWAAGNGGSGKANVKGAAWNILIVKATETGGEWGISTQVDPVPNDVDNVGPSQLFAVESMGKLSTTWSSIKTSY